MARFTVFVMSDEADAYLNRLDYEGSGLKRNTFRIICVHKNIPIKQCKSEN